MTETGQKIEILGNSVNNMIDFMKRNSRTIRKRYTFEKLFFEGIPLSLKMWLLDNNLGLRVTNAEKKRVEMYVSNCKLLAIRFVMS